MLVIPSYLLLHRFVSNKSVLGLDILFTIVSLFETFRIETTHYKSSVEDIGPLELKKFHFGKITKMILAFSLLNVFRSFVDAYGIMYIGKISKNVSIGYTALVFILSIADLLGSLMSKNVIKIENLSQNKILIWSFTSILVLFTIPSVIHNVCCFIITIFLIRLVLSILELFVLYNMQSSVPEKIHQYTALQTMAVDGVSLVNSIAGGFVIQKIDIFNYMKIVILTVLILEIIIKNINTSNAT